MGDINFDNFIEKMESINNIIIKSGKKVAEVLIPVISNEEFNRFVENIKNKKYNEVYSSSVFSAITSLCNVENNVYLKEGTKVFRARIVKDDDVYQERKGIRFEEDKIVGYDWCNSKEPPIGISSEGRANCQYSSYFYCSNEPSTAASEVKANIGDFISLASFIIKKDLKIIKLEKKELFDGKTPEECYQILIANHFSIPVKDSQEYMLTQFISDELRKHGIDGICYKSHFTNKDNYVIFNCSMNNIEFISSKIIRLYSQQLNFIDYSSNKMLSTVSIPKLTGEDILKEKVNVYAMNQSYKDDKLWDDNLNRTNKKKFE